MGECNLIVVVFSISLLFSCSPSLPPSSLLGKARGLEVTQVFPEEGNLGLVLPTHLCKWTTEKVRQEGVKIVPNTLVSSVAMSEEGRVKVSLSNGSEVRCPW